MARGSTCPSRASTGPCTGWAIGRWHVHVPGLQLFPCLRRRHRIRPAPQHYTNSPKVLRSRRSNHRCTAKSPCRCAPAQELLSPRQRRRTRMKSSSWEPASRPGYSTVKAGLERKSLQRASPTGGSSNYRQKVQVVITGGRSLPGGPWCPGRHQTGLFGSRPGNGNRR